MPEPTAELRAGVRARFQSARSIEIDAEAGASTAGARCVDPTHDLAAAMSDPNASFKPEACPASAVVAAMRCAKAPLAVADLPDASIRFANDAFAALAGREAAALVGLRLVDLGVSDLGAAPAPNVFRLSLDRGDGRLLPVALSTAMVTDAEGLSTCLLCSLMDMRGDDADDALGREAALLDQVAAAASGLARASDRVGDEAAPGVALDAIERVIEAERAA